MAFKRVVVVFTLKTVLTSIQYPSLSYSSRQRNEFPWSQAITQNKVQKNKIKNKIKDPEKVPTLARKILYRFRKKQEAG